MDTSTDQTTQLLLAREHVLSQAVETVAAYEHRSADFVRHRVETGRVVIPANRRHTKLRPVGIGADLYTKINANIGNSALSSCPEGELAKLEVAIRYGADTVMDLSTGPDVDRIRTAIMAHSEVPVGTVPIYEAVCQVEEPEDLSAGLLLDVIAKQAEQGVDYMTLHVGLLRDHLPLAEKRLMGIVSRGGAILAKWMRCNGKQNLLYSHFDRILEICLEYDVTLSLGDGLRPGCLADASDEAQFAELRVLGELVQRCRDAGVQSMVEGPGHIPLHQIQMNMEQEAQICDGAPFYVLGPVVTDCAPGYDHITSAIGAALGAYHGAAMLCYVTPKEHLGLPNIQDVRAGVVAYKIAAHAADIALGKPQARERDDAISRARLDFDWERQFELALDPDRARELREESLRECLVPGTPDGPPGEAGKYCTMCGPRFCSMKLFGDKGDGKTGREASTG